MFQFPTRKMVGSSPTDELCWWSGWEERTWVRQEEAITFVPVLRQPARQAGDSSSKRSLWTKDLPARKPTVPGAFLTLETNTATWEKGCWLLSFKQWCGHKEPLFPISQTLNNQLQHISTLQKHTLEQICAWGSAHQLLSLTMYLSQLLLWEASCSSSSTPQLIIEIPPRLCCS